MKKLSAVVLLLMFVFAGCSSKEPVVVMADFLTEENIPDTTGMETMEIITLSEEYDLFIRDDSKYSRFVVFSANTKVKDFELYTIAIPASDKIEYTCGKPVLNYDGLSAEKSLVIQMAMPETLPWYGISYKDENGDTVKYAIFTSGYDGSVILEKFE